MAQGSSKAVEERIVTHVMKDLDPSWLVSHTKVAIASIVGGLLSLVICGQFGFGFTQVANTFNHAIHSNMGAVPCAIICGTLYAIFPISVLRFVLCQPLQFRAIMKRRWQAVIVWFGGFGGVMASFGHHGSDVVALAGWIIGALIAANIIAQVMFALVPMWDLQARLRLQRI